MPLSYFPGKYGPEISFKIFEVPFNNSPIPREDGISDANAISVPEEFDVENGLTGMKSSVNIRLMKHIGFDSKKIRAVSF
jgi:hypothetical protein